MKSILIRYSFALLVGLSSGLFSLFFLPITFYVSYFLLQIFYDVQIYGMSVQFAEVSFSFIPACAATLAYVLLLELLLLTRGISFLQGLKMFFLGSIFIFSLNIVRILVLIFVYINYGNNYFDAVHILFWHLVSTIFVAGVWILLVEKYKVKTIPIWSDVQEIVKK
ncbi:MAG: pacearchaeosortase [bacterium]|nr:pacearchaeosortase [bacterium]